MNQNQPQKKKSEEPKSKQKMKDYLVMGLAAVALGYIITKDVYIPPVAMVILALAAGAWLLFKGINEPVMVTYALVAYLPYSKQLAGDFGAAAMGFNFTNLLMLFIMVVWFSGKHSKNDPMWIGSPLNIPIFLFMAYGFAAVIRGSSLLGEGLLYGVIDYKRWITPIFLYFLVLNTVKDRATIKNVALIIMTATVVVSLMAIYDYMNVGNVSSLEKARIGGIADQPNMLAAFFNYYMLLPLGFFLMNLHDKRYWVLLVPLALCVRGIMVTFSRGGYLGLAVGIYAVMFFKSKKAFAFLLLATAFIYFFPQVLPAGIRYRMGQTFVKNDNYSSIASAPIEQNLEDSSKKRVEIWKGAVEMIKDYPIFGIGYGLFSRRIPEYYEGGRIDAHNTYLIIAAEMGIPELLIFLWIVWIVFWQTWKLYTTTKDPFAKALALGHFGGIFGLLLSNMFGSRLDSQEISSYFWIIAALIVRLRIIDRQEAEQAAENERRGIKPTSQSDEDAAAQKKYRGFKLDGMWGTES